MTTDAQEQGWVFYIDGSFRQSRGGWGIHGYRYANVPMKKGIGVNQVPTDKGYRVIELTETVTPIEYIDAFGPTINGHTNNIAELEALLQVFVILEQYPHCPVTILGDSEYVLKGYDKGLAIWPKKGWLTSSNEPVANKGIWQQLLIYKQKIQERKQRIVFIKVAGHSGNLGNDLADLNARTGSGGMKESVQFTVDPTKYHKPEVECNPLFMKTRLLFNIGKPVKEVVQPSTFYFFYQLGRMSSFGHKQGDSVEDRYDKSDLLLGRRIADATFSVVRLNEQDPYIEQLKAMHRNAFDTDIVELAIARLDNAYRPIVYDRINRMQTAGIVVSKENDAIVTAHDELITKTLNPPRLAMDAVDQFMILQERLMLFLNQTEAKGITQIDITDQFFTTEESKKKTIYRLHKEITTNTPFLSFKTQFKGNDVVIKLVLGIDIPVRNTLAKFADDKTRVTLLIVANGPLSYSFATVFQTDYGDAIYQSPYSQFVIPKKT